MSKDRERYNIAHLYARKLIIHKYKSEYDAFVALKYKELGGTQRQKKADLDALLADAETKLRETN